MTGGFFYFAGGETKSLSPAAAPSPHPLTTEARLVERARGGDGRAFDELYKLFAPLVHGIVLARVPVDDVNDIVQEVFMLAHKNLHALRESGAFGAWLSMIARNHSTEFHRRAKRTEELPEDLSDNENLQATQQEAREILSAIRALPDSYRETLILRLVEGMTGAEIAERCGLKPESVRVNLHRGMKMLRRKLGVEEK